jgi:acyl-CoA synthetase (AMP-forming)/AMP-acid ligase II
VVSGYLTQTPEASAAFVDGWLPTGDLARRVAGGKIELCGRQKYFIKRGGRSISPIEIQDRVEACPGVVSCAVVGVKQALYGEMIWAFVVTDPAHEVTLAEVMKSCRATLPNYMVPDQVTFVAELPRGSGVGKLDREALVSQAEGELSRLQGANYG